MNGYINEIHFKTNKRPITNARGKIKTLITNLLISKHKKSRFLLTLNAIKLNDMASETSCLSISPLYNVRKYYHKIVKKLNIFTFYNSTAN